MERVIKHTEAVVDFLKSMAIVMRKDEEVYEQLIFDDERRHYMLVWIGFTANDAFIDRIIVHFEVRPDGKVWVLANWTERDVAQELMDRGLKAEDIVLGFFPKHERVYTDFAVI